MYNTLDFEHFSYMLDPTILNRDTSISLYGFESWMFPNSHLHFTAIAISVLPNISFWAPMKCRSREHWLQLTPNLFWCNRYFYICFNVRWVIDRSNRKRLSFALMAPRRYCDPPDWVSPAFLYCVEVGLKKAHHSSMITFTPVKLSLITSLSFLALNVSGALTIHIIILKTCSWRLGPCFVSLHAYSTKIGL